MQETWKPIPKWEQFYEVSNLGRVRSLHPNSRSNGCLRAFKLNNGYWAVNLSANGCRKLSSLHRLVLEAFVGPIPPEMEGSHLDGDRSNNTLENLRIETPLENAARRVQHGTQVTNVTNAKIDAQAAARIRELAASGVKQRVIADQFGITQSNVSKLLSGLTWR